MKTNLSLRTAATTLVMLGISTAAQAASTNKIFLSSTLIYLFLGLCAAVIVIQLMPAIVMLYGMIRGAWESRKMAAHGAPKPH